MKKGRALWEYGNKVLCTKSIEVVVPSTSRRIALVICIHLLKVVCKYWFSGSRTANNCGILCFLCNYFYFLFV